MRPERDLRHRSGFRLTIALALAIFLAVVGLRWGSATNFGEQLVPWPDALEYVAGAQSLADAGRYYLALGPWELQPRYPPGLSLALAPLVKAGVAGDQLWRVGALVEAAVALLLFWIVRAFVLRRKPEAGVAALTAGFGAAACWSLSPVIGAQSSLVMSDQPALLVALLGLLAVARAMRPAADGARDRRIRIAAWFAAGVAIGAVTTLRVVEGMILAGALLPITVGVLWRQGRREALRTALLVALGAAIPFAVTAAVLHRSGYPALRWSTYKLWTPATFVSGKAFALENVTRAEALPLPARREGRFKGTSNLEFVVRALPGLPGAPKWDAIGLAWPAIGLAALFWLAAAQRSRGPDSGSWIASIALWCGLHVVLVLLYAFSEGRLLLAPYFAITAAFWVYFGHLAKGSTFRRIAALLLASAALATAAHSAVTKSRLGWQREDLNSKTRAAFARWIEEPRHAAAERLPFDPVRAQALGLLDERTRARVLTWGSLQTSWHWRILRTNGLIRKLPDGRWAVSEELLSRRTRGEARTDRVTER